MPSNRHNARAEAGPEVQREPLFDGFTTEQIHTSGATIHTVYSV